MLMLLNILCNQDLSNMRLLSCIAAGLKSLPYHECLWDFVSVEKCNTLFYVLFTNVVFYVILSEQIYL